MERPPNSDTQNPAPQAPWRRERPVTPDLSFSVQLWVPSAWVCCSLCLQPSVPPSPFPLQAWVSGRSCAVSGIGVCEKGSEGLGWEDRWRLTLGRR